MPSHRRTTLARLAVLAAAALLATGLVACGDDDDGGDGATGQQASAVEKAFLTGMVHHHESAVDMAEIAEERSEDPFVKGLAEDIVSTQEREIARMEEIYERRFGGELKPDPGAHDGLGLTAAAAGMTHSPETNEMLRSADPFDRAFVDEMVPHHRGAVKMSNVVLRQTEDAALRRLAEGIVSTQEREILGMNDFRTREYGAPVPAGAGHGGESKGEKEHGEGHSR